MSAVDLDQIEALAAAATEGPWVAHPDGLVWTEKPRIGDPVSGSVEIEDAELIAAARTAVPQMAAELRRLRAELAAARPQVYTTEPGPEVTAVWDCDGDKWTRHPKGGWQRGPFGDSAPWEHLTIWAPITTGPAGLPVAVQPTSPAVEPTDRQLLAAVHRWARTHGWHAYHTGWANAEHDRDATLYVAWCTEFEDVTVRRRNEAGGWRVRSYPVASAREAVDVLAAVGVLPVELSSAHRAGVAAR